jgi:integrase
MEVFRSKVAEGKEPQAEKLLMVMRGVFDHAIDQGWMDRNQNPALGTRGTKTKHKATPHPTLPWDQLPQFFEDLERNEANGTLVLCSAVKVVLMTFLRVGSLVPMRWEELDESKDLWMIPGTRMKTGHDHLVPLTDPLKEVLDSLRKVSGDEEFVFASPRSRSTPYLNPYSINQHFIRLGYKGVQTAHGLRRTALTAGQEVLGFPAELIQRQLSHAIGDKVRQAYDDSTLIDERRKFMIAWSDALLAQGMKV